MKMRLRFAVTVLFVLIFTACSTESVEDVPVVTVENEYSVEQDLLEIVNEHRATLGINTLLYSEVAYKYANLHTDYMMAKGNISHDNFSSRAAKIDSEVSVKMVAENVAKDYDTAIEAFEGWYNSTSHKKTMEGDFTHTAVSIKKNNEGNYYFTQLFYKQ